MMLLTLEIICYVNLCESIWDADCWNTYVIWSERMFVLNKANSGCFIWLWATKIKRNNAVWATAVLWYFLFSKSVWCYQSGPLICIRCSNHMQTNSYSHNLVYTNVLSTNATHIVAYMSVTSSLVSYIESFNVKEKKSTKKNKI